MKEGGDVSDAGPLGWGAGLHVLKGGVKQVSDVVGCGLSRGLWLLCGN